MKVVIRIGSSSLSSVRGRIPRNRIVLALGAVVLASLTTAVRAPATPNMQGGARESASLRDQVIHLFDRLDHVSQVIEKVGADIEWARARIAELSGQIEAKQELLNDRAAEAYMGLAGGFESALGASSVTELRDTLEFIDAISQRDHDVLVALERRKAEIEQEQVRLEALEVKLRERRERLQGTAADLVEKLQEQETLRARSGGSAQDVGSAGGSPSSSPTPEPPAPTLAPPRAVVIALIRDRFGSRGARTTDVALCIAERESNFDPLVVNPATGAAGVFQFMPSTWASLSVMAGWGGASVFDARANVAVAAWTVAHYGWHPWRSVAADCGV
jgi:Transglycosylase SLT domain